MLKLSMYVTKTIAVIALLWGVVMWGTTLWLSGTDGIGSIQPVLSHTAMAGMMAESMVFFAYCICRGSERTGGRFLKWFLYWYPGLMLWFPLSGVAIWLLMNVTAVPFETMALITGAMTVTAVFGSAKILSLTLRYEDSRIGVLYVADVAVFLLCIVLSGL